MSEAQSVERWRRLFGAANEMETAALCRSFAEALSAETSALLEEQSRALLRDPNFPEEAKRVVERAVERARKRDNDNNESLIFDDSSTVEHHRDDAQHSDVIKRVENRKGSIVQELMSKNDALKVIQGLRRLYVKSRPANATSGPFTVGASEMPFLSVTLECAEELRSVEVKDFWTLNSKILQIDGAAGAGRTTLCRFINHTWWRQDEGGGARALGWLGDPFDIVLYVPLLSLKMSGERLGPRGIASFLFGSAFEGHTPQGKTVDAAAFIAKALRALKDNVLYIFDGLDEVISGGRKVAPAFMADLKALVEGSFVGDWLEHAIITGDKDVPHVVGSRRLRMRRFDETSLKRFIDQFFSKSVGAAAPADLERRKLSIQETLWRDTKLLHLYSLPLMAELLCAQIKDGIANNMWTVFERHVERLRYWSFKRGDEVLEKELSQANIDALTRMALCMLREEGLITYDMLCREQPVATARSELIRSGVLVKDMCVANSYHFLHSTVRDFLAAQQMAELLENEPVKNWSHVLGDLVTELKSHNRMFLLFLLGLIEMSDNTGAGRSSSGKLSRSSQPLMSSQERSTSGSLSGAARSSSRTLTNSGRGLSASSEYSTEQMSSSLSRQSRVATFMGSAAQKLKQSSSSSSSSHLSSHLEAQKHLIQLCLHSLEVLLPNSSDGFVDSTVGEDAGVRIVIEMISHVSDVKLREELSLAVVKLTKGKLGIGRRRKGLEVWLCESAGMFGNDFIIRELAEEQEALDSALKGAFAGAQTELVSQLVLKGANVHDVLQRAAFEGISEVVDNLLTTHPEGLEEALLAAVRSKKWRTVTLLARKRGDTPGLSSLTLQDCSEVGDEFLEELTSKFPTITSLDISRCSSVTDVGVQSIARHCTQLKSLCLFACFDVGNDAVKALGDNCKLLQSLNLGFCWRVSESALIELSSQCKRLNDLNLTCCSQVSDIGLFELAPNLPHLSRLDLSDCSITDDGLSALSEHCIKLTKLRLWRCKDVTDAGLIDIKSKIPSIEIDQNPE